MALGLVLPLAHQVSTLRGESAVANAGGSSVYRIPIKLG
jgi:hypothetical protein